jgi:hypothetical protein
VQSTTQLLNWWRSKSSSQAFKSLHRASPFQQQHPYAKRTLQVTDSGLVAVLALSLRRLVLVAVSVEQEQGMAVLGRRVPTRQVSSTLAPDLVIKRMRLSWPAVAAVGVDTLQQVSLADVWVVCVAGMVYAVKECVCAALNGSETTVRHLLAPVVSSWMGRIG